MELKSILKWGSLWALLFVSGCYVFPSEQKIQTLTGYTMGTSYSIKIVSDDATANTLHTEIDAFLTDFSQIMSTYIDDSELSLLNASSAQAWIELDPQLFDVIELSLRIASMSEGAYDPTIAPLVNLWGFGPTAKPEKIPSAADIQLLQKQVGFTALELDNNSKQIFKHAQRQIDLSSIAKGFGVDQVAELLEQAGIQRYLVEIGGEMRLRGHKLNDQPWTIAIETPDSSTRGVYQTFSVTDVGFATSGDYRNYFEMDGVRFSHTIDPATGFPIAHDLVSVTVIANTSAEADAWATAFNVMGFERAKQLADKMSMAVYLIRKTDDGFVEYVSDQFLPLINK